jgi:hypothetical protein
MSDESRPLPSPVPPQDRRGGVTLGPDHTRIPNQLIDLVYPWLSAGEKACLMYIIRRTYGFVSPTHPRQRKQWDRIALSQFIDGTSSGGYVLDLGAGMTRPAVISSLGKLEERELVRVSYECPTTLTKSGRAVGCGWNEGDEDHLQRPVIDPKTNAHSCPRCSRTLSKAYALRKLTPGWIKRFLNANDPAGREWSYDPEVGRFYPENVDSEEPAGKADQTAEKIKELQAKIWFPDLLDKIVGDATSRLKSGKMASSRLLREFLEPTLVMQDKLPREAVQYGMQEVIKRRIAAQPGKRGWSGYAKACAQGFAERKHGGGVAVEQAMQQAGVEMELERCAQLNRDGQKEEARRVLQELLSANLDKLQEEFSGDRALARRHVLEAYKRGISDYAYVRDYTSTADWLPEWDWLRDEGSSPPVPQAER